MSGTSLGDVRHEDRLYHAMRCSVPSSAVPSYRMCGAERGYAATRAQLEDNAPRPKHSILTSGRLTYWPTQPLRDVRY
eukprot:1574855-Rhodomonas_salina.1